jgi:hypothetical protein
MTANLSLALPFDTDGSEFRRGVEIGMLWEQTERAVVPVQATVHADCAEMVIRIAEARGVPFTAEPIGDDWLAVTIGVKP